MSGPPKKPTKLKSLSGTDYPYRRVQGEPLPTAGLLPPLDRYGDFERSVWCEFGEIVESMGVMTHADVTALELMVDAYVEYRAAKDVLATCDQYYETETKAHGRVIKEHPSFVVADRAWRKVERLLKEFGMTPASRSKVRARVDRTQDEDVRQFFGT